MAGTGATTGAWTAKPLRAAGKFPPAPRLSRADFLNAQESAMVPTPDQATAGYRRLWDRARIAPASAAAVRTVADKIIAQRARYEAIERATGVPWFMIAPIHNRESSLRFDAH